MTSAQLFQAIEDGATLHRDFNGQETHRMTIEPYRGHENTLGFHLYGWGSACWSTEGVIARILSHPDEFGIGPAA